MSNTNVKYDVNINVKNIDVNPEQINESGIIPENLVALSAMVIALHRENGDLAWLIDMAHEAERNNPELGDEYKIDAYIP